MSQNNFTVSYTTEGDFIPITITNAKDNLLYYAMALDVKAKQEQKESKSIEQPLYVVKAFLKALIDDDLDMIDSMIVQNSELLNLVCKDEQMKLDAIQKAKLINDDSWELTYHLSSLATVKAKINDSQLGALELVFKLVFGQLDNKNMGQDWHINTFC